MSEKEEKIEIGVKGKDKVNVIVDTETTRRLAEEKQKLQDELDFKKLEERRQTAAERTGYLEFLDCQSLEELDALSQKLMKEGVKRTREAQQGQQHGGFAPLNEQQMGVSQDNSDLRNRKFSGYTEMLTELHRLSNQGNLEAKSYLNELTQKFLYQPLMNKQSSPIELDLNKQPLPETTSIPLIRDGKTPIRKEDGDIGSYMEAFRISNKRIQSAKKQLAVAEGENKQ